MKTKLIIFFTCVSALLFISCEQKDMYHSGRYFYRYYLVNKTSSPITIEWLDQGQSYNMKANDSTIILNVGVAYTGNDLMYIQRPTLEDGYKGTVDAGSYTLTYQDKVYEINETQENTFTHCANYKGYENPKSVFLYDYFFVIDEAYIATLPLKK